MVVEGFGFIEALYFSIVTIATVGYGDVHPVTQAGRLLAIFLIALGVGTFLGVVANATEIMLARREHESRLKNLNMVIGVFFSEVGTSLLAALSEQDPGLERIRGDLVVKGTWKDDDFSEVSNRLRSYVYDLTVGTTDLSEMKSFLGEKRDFLLRLLENPSLLEHEKFTDLLRAVFHLAEELESREDITGLPDADRQHLGGDMKRVYGLLMHQWLDYMHYLKTSYPYLFSLAVRKNPFDPAASPIVRG
ncbi:MAG: two pore domain potassium channel family protein [Deltaproteobacteria bacterium]|nr:two pore domain potassium channel family protein [Deltaproteobacteria bacterium]